jgi:hypothetical protein
VYPPRGGVDGRIPSTHPPKQHAHTLTEYPVMGMADQLRSRAQGAMDGTGGIRYSPDCTTRESTEHPECSLEVPNGPRLTQPSGAGSAPDAAIWGWVRAGGLAHWG